jgi:hypothetical protein
MSSLIKLQIQQVERTCLFTLAWGSDLQRSAQAPLPEQIWHLYEQWQRFYLNFYSTQLRGKAVASGSGTAPTIDLASRLGEAEARLLSEFHRWLRHPDLFPITEQIVQLASVSPNQKTELLIACSPLDLARLPWEQWEIGLAPNHHLAISRTSPNLVHDPVPRRRDRPRALVIIGDDTGLNFQREQEALQGAFRPGDIQFVGWQPGKALAKLETEIKQAIADEQGWDLLFFAGHSNETQSTGGELGIAPQRFMSIQDIAPQLAIARRHGLQFALFNSCKGLGIAESLMELGFSQVAVMREPVHNQVAEEFLVRFLGQLANYQDVQTALQAAATSLKVDRSLTYPSASLVPSLFRHPRTRLFQISPPSWRRTLRKLLPNRREAVAIALLGSLSLYQPAQFWLLEQRVWVQAIYRNLTGQIGQTEPPLLIVQIDDQSLQQAEISDPAFMNREYIAEFVEQATAMDAAVIGIDYLLDRPLTNTPGRETEDQALENALKQTFEQRQPYVVFAAKRNDNRAWLTALPKFTTAIAGWDGNAEIFAGGRSMTLLPTDDRPLPFSYLMALGYTLQAQSPNAQSPRPPDRTNPKALIPYLSTPRMHPLAISQFSYRLGQTWLRPIVDFSQPPEQVYAQIPAWEFLSLSPEQLRQQYPQRVIMLASGGYSDAGITPGGDRVPVPGAVRYWWQQGTAPQIRDYLSGGEVHAYLFHQFWHQRLVVPVPDIWILALAVLVGKGLWCSCPGAIAPPAATWQWPLPV